MLDLFLMYWACCTLCNEEHTQLNMQFYFSNATTIAQHVEDIIAALPRAVWLQSGITHAESEERFARAGILVASDRCLKVDRAAALAQSNL